MADLIEPLLNLRTKALWPLPIVDAVLLSGLWILFMIFRNGERLKKGVVTLLWFRA